jgi:transcriptional antiterminator NusG
MSESTHKWYVIRAMSGKEKSVKEYIDIELKKNSNLSRYITQMVIPTEKVYVVRNGKKVVKEKTFLPGYVLIEAALTREISGYIRNVPNVIGFLGVNEAPGNYQPIPLRPTEVNRLLGTVDALDDQQEDMLVPYLVGENVKIIVGPFSGFSGVIEEVNNEKKRLRVEVKIFGRKTPLELGFMQVEKEL